MSRAPSAYPELVVIVPAYREAEVLAEVLAPLRPLAGEVVVVDDGSPDGTSAAALAAGATLLPHAVNRGQGAALRTGFAYARARGAGLVATYDADGQHRPEDLVALVEGLREAGAEVALASRFAGAAEGMPAGRGLLLRLATAFTRASTGLSVSDTHNGLRVFTGAALARLRLSQDGMAHASEILHEVAALGLRWVEVPVTVRYTAYSRAKGQSGLAAAGILADLVVGWLVGGAARGP